MWENKRNHWSYSDDFANFDPMLDTGMTENIKNDDTNPDSMFMLDRESTKIMIDGIEYSSWDEVQSSEYLEELERLRLSKNVIDYDENYEYYPAFLRPTKPNSFPNIGHDEPYDWPLVHSEWSNNSEHDIHNFHNLFQNDQINDPYTLRNQSREHEFIYERSGEQRLTSLKDYFSTPKEDYSSTVGEDYSSIPKEDYSSAVEEIFSPTPYGDYSFTSKEDCSSTPYGDYSSMHKEDYSPTVEENYSPTPYGDFSSASKEDYSSMPKEDYSSTVEEDSSSMSYGDYSPPQNRQYSNNESQELIRIFEEKRFILESQKEREQQRRNSNLKYINYLRKIVPSCRTEKCTVERVLELTAQHIINMRNIALKRLQNQKSKLDIIRRRIYRQR